MIGSFEQRYQSKKESLLIWALYIELLYPLSWNTYLTSGLADSSTYEDPIPYYYPIYPPDNRALVQYVQTL